MTNNLKERQAHFEKKLHKKAKHTGETIKQVGKYVNKNTPIKMISVLYGFKYTFYLIPRNIKPYSHYLFGRTKSIKEFEHKLIAKEHKTHEKIVQLSPYVNEDAPIRFKYLKNNDIFSTTPKEILSSHHRYYIYPKNPNRPRIRWTTASLAKAIFNKTHGKYILKSKYHTIHKKVLIEHHDKRCLYYQKHHKYYLFHVSPNHFLYSNSRCPMEHFIKISNHEAMSSSKFKHEVFNRTHGQFKVLTPYVRSRKKILIMHYSKSCIFYRSHHHFYKFWAWPAKFLCELSCPKDSIHNGLIKRLKECRASAKKRIYKKFHGKFRLVGKYINSSTDALFEHHDKNCTYYKSHHKYYRFYSSLQSVEYYGCPYDSSSAGERCMISWLNMKHLKMSKSKHHLTKHSDFIYGYITKLSPYTIYPQHFDIFIPNIKYDDYYTNGVEIEFNGGQHFKPKIYFSNTHTKRGAIITYGLRISKDFLKSIYCYKYHIKQINIDNHDDKLIGKKLHRLVNRTLNKKLLPVLHRNSDIIFREENC